MISDWVALQTYINCVDRQKRNLEMEKIISKNGEIAYFYALRVLHRPFPEAEPAIAKHPNWAVRYARFIIRKRFNIAEESIATDPRWCYEYYRHVIGKRLPDKMHERLLLMSYEQPHNYFLNKYFKEILNKA